MRKILFVLLGLGAFGGFAHGFHSLHGDSSWHHGSSSWGECHSGDAVER